MITLLGTALLFQTGCSKTKAEPTKAERIKAIDAQLAHWVLTGHPEDVARRDALKAERALLAADLGYSTSTVTPVYQAVAATPVPGAPNIIVAPGSKENRWDPMAGESRWMDPNTQTHVHSGTIYPGGTYYRDYSDPNGTTTYRRNPRP